ncbi:hypothetical protein SO802_016144 [Lithocarpus litseifolius]|uniref:Uncharacterized protein n=1 Tax=Lithocarpus litseifolius TaxID=425828 RepID=A0AAW2CY55_9ROSI
MVVTRDISYLDDDCSIYPPIHHEGLQQEVPPVWILNLKSLKTQIQNQVPYHQCHPILKVMRKKEDSLIWSATPNGKFLVRSAYKIAMESRVQPDSSSYSNNSDMKTLWKVLWGLKIPNKKSGEEVLSLVVTIAWALWTRRNEKGNGKQFMSGFELVKWCGKYIESFKATNSSNLPSSANSANASTNFANAVSTNAATSANATTSATSALCLAKPQCRQVWSPSDALVFKVNVDGAVFTQQ